MNGERKFVLVPQMMCDFLHELLFFRKSQDHGTDMYLQNFSFLLILKQKFHMDKTLTFHMNTGR